METHQIQKNQQQEPQQKSISIGAALILGLSGIIIAGIIAGAIVFSSGAKALDNIDLKDLDGLKVQINEQDNKTSVFVDIQEMKTTYKNYALGFSFFNNKELGTIEFKNGIGTTGKNFFGTQGCTTDGDFCMFISGITSDFTFPGELNAGDVSEYPSDAKLQSLSANGYNYEKRVNINSVEYVLIYGKKEIDMPYIGEGQVVAIFKLTSPTDFHAIGFQLVSGDISNFMQVIESVAIF